MPHVMKKFQGVLMKILSVVMIIGGCIIAFSFLTFPIVRITHSLYLRQIEIVIMLSTATGAVMLLSSAAAGLAAAMLCHHSMCFTGAGIGLSMASSIAVVSGYAFIWINSEEMSSENVLYQWQKLECSEFDSCANAFQNYVTWLMMPQVVLCGVALVLQLVCLIILGKIVQRNARKFKSIQKAISKRQEARRKEEMSNKMNEEFTELQNDDGKPALRNVDYDEMFKTPRSILRGDHGYVQGVDYLEIPTDFVKRVKINDHRLSDRDLDDSFMSNVEDFDDLSCSLENDRKRESIASNCSQDYDADHNDHSSYSHGSQFSPTNKNEFLLVVGASNKDIEVHELQEREVTIVHRNREHPQS